jgi:hypothetical protein
MEKKSLLSKWFGGAVETPANDATVPKAPSVTVERPNVWGMNGRSTQMQIRTLMQLRTFQSKS